MVLQEPPKWFYNNYPLLVGIMGKREMSPLNREIPQICINKGMYILEKYFKVDELDLIDTDYEENE